MTQDHRERDPQDCPDVDLRWVAPDSHLLDEWEAETDARIRQHKDRPDDPIGMPGSMVRAFVFGLPSRMAAGWPIDYSLVHVALCVHGELPPMEVHGAGGGRRWQYCRECAVYMPAECIDSHVPTAYVRNLR